MPKTLTNTSTATPATSSTTTSSLTSTSSLAVSNTITANTLSVSNTITTGRITATGNITVTGTSDVVIGTIPVLSTLKQSAAIAFPNISIGTGTVTGNIYSNGYSTHAYYENNMTGNVVVSCSSVIFNTNAGAKCFDKNFTAYDSWWTTGGTAATNYTVNITGGKTTSTSTVVKTAASGNVSVTGEWLQIQFPISFVPTSYLMVIRTDYGSRIPATWTLAASNNQTDWNELHAGNANTASWTTFGKRFSLSSTQSYNTYRMIVSSIASGSETNAHIVELVYFGLPTYA